MDEASRSPTIPRDCPVLVMTREGSVPVGSSGAWCVVPIGDVDIDDDERAVDLVIDVADDRPGLNLVTLRKRLRGLSAAARSHDVFTAVDGTFEGEDGEWRRHAAIVDVWWDEHGFALLEWSEEAQNRRRDTQSL
jgi:hypothetical protein